MNTKSRKKENRNIPYLYSLTNKIVVFFACLLIVSTVFYITGNFDYFLDSSLLFILRVIQISAIAGIVFCFASIVQSIIYVFIYKDFFYLFVIIPVLLDLFFSFVCFFFAGTIHVVANGM